MVLEDDLVTEHTESDQASVSFIQLVFRARLVKRAVRKLSESVLRSTQPIYTTPELIEILRTESAQRDGEQLDELLGAFHHLPFFKTLSELQQAVCCRAIGLVEYNLNDVVYSSGDPGTTFYIILAGVCTMEADNGRAALQLGVGDSFGHKELLGGDREHRRMATVTASSGTVLATISRTDYLRLTGKLEQEVIEILSIPAQERSDTEIVLVRALFKDTPFFRALHYKMLQDVCCRNMTVATAKQGEDLFHAGDDGSEYFITIEGIVRVVLEGEDERGKAAGYDRDTSKDILLKAGSSFGEIAITSSNPKDWKRSAGIQCVKDCTFAVLSRAHYLQSTSAIEGRVYAALETHTAQRSNVQLELLMTYFHSQPFFKRLGLDGLRRQACSMMFRENVAAGTVLWEKGSKDVQTFHILLRGGPVREVVDGETVGKLHMGDEIGADGLADGTDSRSTTMIADDDCVLATFMKEDYLRIFTVYTVMEWVHKFWDLVTMETFGHKSEDNEHDRVDFGAYEGLHKRISKTIHEKGYFNAKQEKKDAEADWKEDIERAHHGLGGLPSVTLDSLTKTEFCDAIFQLVDVWCEHVEAMDLFVEFLKVVFGSISYFDREQKCFRYKKLGQIKSLHDRLEDIRSVTLRQFKVDEEAREEMRKEMHAERGMQRRMPNRSFGKIVSSSVLIGLMGQNSGLLETATFETDDTGVASGDMADPNDSELKLRGRTKGLISFDIIDGSEQSASRGNGTRWLYSSTADWENIGIFNGGAVMVMVPTENVSSGFSCGDESDEIWVLGTVIRSASDRIVVSYCAGKTATFYSNNPDTYTKISGFRVEYASAGSSTDWQRHSPHISNLIVNAVDTGGVAKFKWQSPVEDRSGKEAADYEVDTQGQMPPAGKLSEWVGLQQRVSECGADALTNRPMKLRLARWSADDQPVGAKQQELRRWIRDPEFDTEEPWKAFGHNTTSALSATSKTQLEDPFSGNRGGPHDAETRELYAVLGEIQLRLAQDHRVPELIADNDSKLIPTPAIHSKYAHGKGCIGLPREYTLAEVKADIKRLVQRGAAYDRCGMLREKDALLTQLNAHRDLLQNLWAFVDNGGRKKTVIAAQEPKRWYVGSGPRVQRPITGITERLGKRRSTSLSFSALIPTTQGTVLTPDDTSGVRITKKYGRSIAAAKMSGQGATTQAGMLPELSQGSIGGAVPVRPDIGADAGTAVVRDIRSLGSSPSISDVHDGMSRRPMQLTRQEYLPPLQSHDRSLARSRKSPYRMRPKRMGASTGVSSSASTKYVVDL